MARRDEWSQRNSGWSHRDELTDLERLEGFIRPARPCPAMPGHRLRRLCPPPQASRGGDRAAAECHAIDAAAVHLCRGVLYGDGSSHATACIEDSEMVGMLSGIAP
jgi:hypothetical protein